MYGSVWEAQRPLTPMAITFCGEPHKSKSNEALDGRRVHGGGRGPKQTWQRFFGGIGDIIVSVVAGGGVVCHRGPPRTRGIASLWAARRCRGETEAVGRRGRRPEATGREDKGRREGRGGLTHPAGGSGLAVAGRLLCWMPKCCGTAERPSPNRSRKETGRG